VAGRFATSRSGTRSASRKQLGFTLARTNGSHHVFVHAAHPALLNLLSVRGEAKPYQLRQMLRLVDRYNRSLAGGES
jgi:predicted RNA binding protein YcfA (HicA-like mRNA interferase family)